MPYVIDVKDVLDKRKKLPTEAFFVDTNIIIFFKDPFGLAGTKANLKETIETIQESIDYLKSIAKTYSTLSVAQEYYKHIQHNTVKFYKNKFEIDGSKASDFKSLRKNNPGFQEEWQLRIKDFKKIFRKNFEIYNSQINPVEAINSFDQNNVDLGDWLLYKTVMSCDDKMKCIFTDDADFYSLPGEFYLLTANQKILELAINDRKLQ
ncbi:MAG: hypothetical protein GXX85_13670 [Ignavibacteria bacterium]|nr:hypothetical protein [Ignavibacteria bacterium]